MDGRGRALDNVFVERLWRTVKYEEVYLKDYETPREAMQGLATFFVRYNEWRQHQALGYQTPASVYFGSYLILQRTFIPVDCTARSGACDERHRRRGSAVASRPRGQGLPVCQRYAWAESRAIAPAPSGWFTPALCFSPAPHPHAQEVRHHNA